MSKSTIFFIVLIAIFHCLRVKVWNHKDLLSILDLLTSYLSYVYLSHIYIYYIYVLQIFLKE